ncbi:MAG: hypothetical protein RJA70_244 [Pseudomonadota bacterium]|jgi:hypothetical protein
MVPPSLSASPDNPQRLVIPPMERDVRARVFELGGMAIVREIRRGLIELKPPAVCQVSGGVAAARVVSVVDAGIELEVRGTLLGGSCTLRISMYEVPFLITGDLEPLAGTRYLLRNPRMCTQDRRVVSRMTLGAGQAVLHWGRLLGGAPEVNVSQVHDLTPGGVLLRLPPGAPIPPSTPFPAVLKLGGNQLRCLAETRNRSQKHGVCHLGLRLRVAASDLAMVDAYLHARFPHLVARHQIDSRVLEKLFADSGYLALRAGEGISEGWRRLASPGSKDMVYRSADGVVLGHMSVTRTYPHAWMIHQLATLSGHEESGVCRTVLYGLVGSVPSLIDGDSARLLAFYDTTLSWHRLFFEQFLDWVDDAALACVVRFDRFEQTGEVFARSPTESPLPLQMEIRRGVAGHELEVTALVRAQLPDLTAELFAIHPDLLNVDELVPGFERGRTVFTLWVDNKLKGAALCETGTRHASLFNLLNMVQLYFCVGSQAPTPSAQCALLARARQYYAELGVDDPVVISPTGTFAGDAEPGTRLAEAMGCIAVSSAGLRQWENFCKFHMGRRFQRGSKSRSASTMSLIQEYNTALSGARESMVTHPKIREILAEDVSPQLLHRFLIQYCALGVQITEPVDGWIRRAGQRCKEVGLVELGESLRKHAEHEAGHHLMFIDDVHALVGLYNSKYGATLNAGALLQQSATPKMRDYIALHEVNIAGDSPFAQVAIELEIEGLSVALGPKLIAQFEARLGKEVVAALSFLNEHIAVDVGHTALNNKLMERLLKQQPEALAKMIETGTAALAIYLDFFGECWGLARAKISSEGASSQLSSSAE